MTESNQDGGYNKERDPLPRDSSAITPTSKSNEPGSAIGQILGKTGGDTYGGLVGPTHDEDDQDEDDKDDEDREDLEPKQRFPGPDEEPESEQRASDTLV
jgi:hypothetical protein